MGNVQRFRGGLVVKAHRLVYHSTLGLRVIKKKKRRIGSMKILLRSSAAPGARVARSCEGGDGLLLLYYSQA